MFIFVVSFFSQFWGNIDENFIESLTYVSLVWNNLRTNVFSSSFLFWFNVHMICEIAFRVIYVASKCIDEVIIMF